MTGIWIVIVFNSIATLVGLFCNCKDYEMAYTHLILANIWIATLVLKIKE